MIATCGMPATTKSGTSCASPQNALLDLKRDPRPSSTSALSRITAKTPGRGFSHPAHRRSPPPCLFHGGFSTNCAPDRIEYFVGKERCVFCDIIQQEEREATRVIEARGDYLAVCPYAPRVPYEAWILPWHHDASFERTGLNKLRIAYESRRTYTPHTLQRVRSVTEDFHPRSSHLSECDSPFEESRLLEDHRRRLSLAHRDPACYWLQVAFLHV